MNIDDSAVNQVAGCGPAPRDPGGPRTRSAGLVARSHSLPGCVSSYGIAP